MFNNVRDVGNASLPLMMPSGNPGQRLSMAFDRHAVRMSVFLSSGSRLSQVNLKSSEWESTTNIFLAFPFAQIAKYELYDNVFMTLNKRKKTERD